MLKHNLGEAFFKEQDITRKGFDGFASNYGLVNVSTSSSAGNDATTSFGTRV